MREKMRSAVLVAPGQTEIEEIPRPEPAAGEVRIAMEGCGVCASNVPPWEGREWFSYPMAPGALGHEGWGRIDRLGAGVTGLAPGQRVASLAQNSFAEFDIASAEAVVPLPDTLDDVPFPGEPLACAINIFRRSEAAPGMTVAVVGIGFLGSLLVQLFSRQGAHVIALARRQSALDCAHRMGASQTVLMDDHWSAIEAVRSMTSGRLCDVVVEATGKQWPLDLAGEITRERGRLLIAGYHQDGLRQVNMQLWNWRGLDVINAHERDPKLYVSAMRSAVDAVLSGGLNPVPLFTHSFPLSDLGAALSATRDRPEGFMKALVMV